MSVPQVAELCAKRVRSSANYFWRRHLPAHHALADFLRTLLHVLLASSCICDNAIILA